MRLPLSRSTIRTWRTDDAPSLSVFANNRRIWLNLKDRFPHPYTLDDARAFIARCQAELPESTFAIEVDGQAIGAVGFEHRGDIWRRSVEIGYWIGEEYWGRGIASEVVRGVTDWAFDAWEIDRVWAAAFDWNAASTRVLEKAGYELEGRLRHSAIKDGRLVDELVYAVVRSEGPDAAKTE